MSIKLCLCGCGNPTPIAHRSDSRKGWIKGNPIQYLQYHHLKNRKRNSRDQDYYRNLISNLIGDIPKKIVIHHVDGNCRNNSNDNLVVCQDHSYHMLLHQRQRALKVCGHASWRKCNYCAEYDAVENLDFVTPANAWHYSCRNKYRRNRNGK